MEADTAVRDQSQKPSVLDKLRQIILLADEAQQMYHQSQPPVSTPTLPRSDGERETLTQEQIAAHNKRLLKEYAKKLRAEEIAHERTRAELSSLREQLGRAQRDSERLDWISQQCDVVAVESADAVVKYDPYDHETEERLARLREAIDSAKSAAVARETGE